LRESPRQHVGGHTTALGYRRKFPTEFATYFKFAVVRDPVSRFLSAWRYLRKMPIHPALNNSKIHERDTLAEWMETVRADPNLLDDIVHFLPQRRFVCDSEGRVLVDHLFRFESITSQWKTICGILNQPFRPLPRVNESAPMTIIDAPPDWMHGWITEFYADDYRVGGYPILRDSASSARR
ncbi:MAG: sulfotransferase family 2 domain-containing protein, partial [Verrucomicrobiae bacterium]|nr:sulfotransferase family 2 domain-containing protein [Verrucomicrobiae bacterium]